MSDWPSKARQLVRDFQEDTDHSFSALEERELSHLIHELLMEARDYGVACARRDMAIDDG